MSWRAVCRSAGNLTRHIVRGYREKKMKATPRERMQENVEERGRICSGDEMRKGKCEQNVEGNRKTGCIAQRAFVVGCHKKWRPG